MIEVWREAKKFQKDVVWTHKCKIQNSLYSLHLHQSPRHHPPLPPSLHLHSSTRSEVHFISSISIFLNLLIIIHLHSIFILPPYALLHHKAWSSMHVVPCAKTNRTYNFFDKKTGPKRPPWTPKEYSAGLVLKLWAWGQYQITGEDAGWTPKRWVPVHHIQIMENYVVFEQPSKHTLHFYFYFLMQQLSLLLEKRPQKSFMLVQAMWRHQQAILTFILGCQEDDQ